MEDPPSDIQEWDWEVLHTSEQDNTSLDLAELGEVELDSSSHGGVIRSDYFSLDFGSNHQNYAPSSFVTSTNSNEEEEEEEEESDNPASSSWIDPAQFSDNMRRRKDSCSSESDSSLDSRKHLQFLVQPHFGCANEYEQSQEFADSQLGLDKREIAVSDQIWSDSGGKETVIESISQSLSEEFDYAFDDKLDHSAKFNEEEEEEEEQETDHKHSHPPPNEMNDNNCMDTTRIEKQQDEENDAKSSSSSPENGKRRVVWWKVPMELLKYCVFRVRPSWSLSVFAAAFMGFILLGRRLYKMKRKTQGLQLKVTVDDKKVSQFMSRAARLNEAFSVVKRVPVIRPSLPAPPLAPWPVMSLR